SVTIPISRSSSPIGMQPMSCSRINFASSVTGVLGLTQSTPLCITSLTFMADLRCWVSGAFDAMRHSPRFLNYTTDRVRRHQRPRSQKKHHSYVIGPDKRRRCRCRPAEHSTETSRPGFPPNIAKAMGRAHSTRSRQIQVRHIGQGTALSTSLTGSVVARLQMRPRGMKEKKDIVENWLPRYTGTPLAEFGEYVLLPNFA